jgi:hypothetical protein
LLGSLPAAGAGGIAIPATGTAAETETNAFFGDSLVITLQVTAPVLSQDTFSLAQAPGADCQASSPLAAEAPNGNEAVSHPGSNDDYGIPFSTGTPPAAAEASLPEFDFTSTDAQIEGDLTFYAMPATASDATTGPDGSDASDSAFFLTATCDQAMVPLLAGGLLIAVCRRMRVLESSDSTAK